MKLFSSESIYNAKTDKWEERYWIDGDPVDGDLYFFEMERERNLENQKLINKIEECEDDDCDCVNCTIDRYAEMIYELANGQICPGCVHDVLESFFETMVDYIIIESLEED